jgi:hypothetical protein
MPTNDNNVQCTVLFRNISLGKWSYYHISLTWILRLSLGMIPLKIPWFPVRGHHRTAVPFKRLRWCVGHLDGIGRDWTPKTEALGTTICCFCCFRFWLPLEVSVCLFLYSFAWFAQNNWSKWCVSVCFTCKCITEYNDSSCIVRYH